MKFKYRRNKKKFTTNQIVNKKYTYLIYIDLFT